MKQNKKLLAGYKLAFGLLGFSAVVNEIATLAGRGDLNLANFFSYFTIESNVLVFAVLLVSAVATYYNKALRLDALRSAVAVYILIVGIGFAALLSGLQDIEFTAVPWDNIVLHYIMPVAMLADLLFDRPSRRDFKRSLAWLLFPTVYVAYSLIRGAIVGWYPYPFLDPHHRGVLPVCITVVGLMVLALGLTWGVTWLPARGKDTPAQSSAKRSAKSPKKRPV